jgi:hypothetical protein
MVDAQVRRHMLIEELAQDLFRLGFAVHVAVVGNGQIDVGDEMGGQGPRVPGLQGKGHLVLDVALGMEQQGRQQGGERDDDA